MTEERPEIVPDRRLVQSLAEAFGRLAVRLRGRPVTREMLNRLPELDAVNAAAIACDRELFGTDIVPQGQAAWEQTMTWAVGSFLVSSGFVRMAADGETIDGSALASAFFCELYRRRGSVTRLAVLDDLCVRGADCSLGEGVRLLTLTREYLDQFFHIDRTCSGIPLDDLVGLAALELVRPATSRRDWEDSGVWSHTDRRIRHLSWPFLSYLELWPTTHVVRPIALYERSDRIVDWPTIRSSVVEMPFMMTRLNDGDRRWFHRFTSSLDRVEDFARWVQELERGREAAATRHESADAVFCALDCYSEACEQLASISAVDAADYRTTRHALISLAECLETVFNASERNDSTTSRMAECAAALCRESAEDRGLLRRQILRACDLRSQVLDGRSEQPSLGALEWAIGVLHDVTRRSVIALLQANGRRPVAGCEPASTRVL